MKKSLAKRMVAHGSARSGSAIVRSIIAHNKKVARIKALRRLHKMRKIQDDGEFMFSMAPFKRLVREITENYKLNKRFRPNAFEALAEGTQGYMTEVFVRAQHRATHAKRKTIMVNDLQAVMWEMDRSNF